MAKKKKRTEEQGRTSVFRTQAITEVNRIDPVTKAAIPSHEAIEEAKDWVDYNEK